MSLIIFIAKLFYFFLPAGVGNMAPVLVKNHFRVLASPIDGGKMWRNKPIFGSHKTWRGIICAVLFGGIWWLGQYYLVHIYEATVSWSAFDLRHFPWWFGFFFAFCAILGDLLKSFFKRQLNIAPGKTWFPFDQIDFLIGASIAASFYVKINWKTWLAIIFVGPLFHILVNHLGYWLKIKKKAW